MQDFSKTDFNNLNYIQVGAGTGVAAGILWGMKNNLSGKTTILYVLALGIAGAYLGNTLDNYRKKKDNEK